MPGEKNVEIKKKDIEKKRKSKMGAELAPVGTGMASPDNANATVGKALAAAKKKAAKLKAQSTAALKYAPPPASVPASNDEDGDADAVVDRAPIIAAPLDAAASQSPATASPAPGSGDDDVGPG